MGVRSSLLVVVLAHNYYQRSGEVNEEAWAKVKEYDLKWTLLLTHRFLKLFTPRRGF